MKVLIDCRGVNRVEDGLSIYILNLVEHLPVADPGARFILIIRPEPDLHPRLARLRDTGTVDAVVLDAPFMRPTQHWQVAGVIRRLGGVDVYHYPHFDLPALMPVPAVITMTDVNYFTIRKYFSAMGLSQLKRVYSMLASYLACTRAKEILALSKHTAESVRRIVGRRVENRITVTPCAVDAMLLPPFVDLDGSIEGSPPSPSGSTVVGRNGWGPYLLYVGTDRYHKNLERLLTAFHSAIQTTDEPWRLFLVGSMQSASQARTDQVVRSMKLENRIVRLGYLSRERLTELYRHAGALCLCSLCEGFGLPVLEAMHYGVPVIASSTGATSEVAGGAALLADPLSVDEIAECMARIMGDSGLRAELCRKGRDRARSYSWEETAKTTAAVYRRVAGK